MATAIPASTGSWSRTRIRNLVPPILVSRLNKYVSTTCERDPDNAHLQTPLACVKR